MGQTLAQRYWSDFERLAFELTKDCFGITPTTVFRTQESKDGGFDAVFVHELGRLGEELISNEVLMEAKLRSSHDTVGLRAFAATMIVAFNGRTHCLVIVTNRQFSPQALTAARDFQWKSRLQVVLASQKTLSAWVRPRREQLVRRYPQELLDDLILPNPADEVVEEIKIPGSPVVGTEPPARIATGRLPDGKLASCEIVLESSYSHVATETVIGRSRQQVVRHLVDNLGAETGCALVLGESGSGKSHIIRSALAMLPSGRRCLGMIDLAQIATSRQLFLATIAHLLGVEVTEIARQFTIADARRVFSSIGGTVVPEEMTDAVLSVLASSGGAKRDLDQIHLTGYLSHVSSGGRAGARLIVFHNLDKAADEVLEFLHAIVPILTSKEISVLIELVSGGDSQLVGPSQWKVHLELFERNSTLGRFLVPSFGPDDAVELLLDQLPGLGIERARFICERVGTRPLFLYHAALWLKRRNVVAERAHGVHLIENAETFFEGLTPEACLSILDRHIDLWRREIDLPYADAITAATMLNGRLSVGATQVLTGGRLRVEALLDALISTGLFIPEPGLEGVRVSHTLLLERMTVLEEGKVPGYGLRSFDRKRVAQVLLDGIATYTAEGVGRDVCRSALLAACEQWPEAWESAFQSGRLLFREHQLAAASGALLRALEAAEKMISVGDARGVPRRVESSIEFLQVENDRYRLGLEENMVRLNALTVSLRITPLSTKEIGGQETLLRGDYLRWRSAFTHEKFDEALPIARSLFARVSGLPNIDQELAGRAVASLGITLKALEQTEESKKVFEEGIACFPASAYCRMERWSNLAALALRNDPAQSLQYLNRILLEIGAELPLLDRIHTEVDVAMALFLAGRREEAATQAARAINLADANGIPAQGARGRNILACVHWSNSRIDDAIVLLSRAILDAERSYMQRFLWRFRVNLASAASEVGQRSTALANARWAEDRLVGARSSQLLDLAAAPTHTTSRWYVATLAIGLTYHRFEAKDDIARLKGAMVPFPKFSRHLEEVSSGNFPPEVFTDTTHLQGNHIMITG